MDKFKVGDRVKFRSGAKVDGIDLEGLTGTLCDLTRGSIYGIKFDLNLSEEYGQGHDCNGYCEQGFGWYVNEEYLILNKKTTMKTLGNMFKRLADADTRALAQAEFINGNLELTTEGEEVLMSIIFSANKTEMVKLANEKIAEAKKDK